MNNQPNVMVHPGMRGRVITPETIQRILNNNQELIFDITDAMRDGNDSAIVPKQEKLHQNLILLSTLANMQFERDETAKLLPVKYRNVINNTNRESLDIVQREEEEEEVI